MRTALAVIGAILCCQQSWPAAPLPSFRATPRPAALVAVASQTSSEMPAQKPPTPAAPTHGTVVPMTQDVLKVLRARATDMLANRDISGARLLYARMAAAGDTSAATAMGKTYAPSFLADIGALGLQPDTAQARAWYEKARASGDKEAETRLQQLR